LTTSWRSWQSKAYLAAMPLHVASQDLNRGKTFINSAANKFSVDERNGEFYQKGLKNGLAWISQSPEVKILRS
jgi:hypothetical protein